MKEAGTSFTFTTNMASDASNSMATELVKAFSLQKRRPQPPYLSESDAVSTQDFSKSTFAEKYVLDIVNLYWPGHLNRNHVFDLFSEFLPHGDSGKIRCDMISFVSDNRARYSMDCHTVLKMHELNLNAWACRMTYFENPADELAIYALSDLVNVHTVILTRTKPWTTLHPDTNLKDTEQMLEICDVKLVYLGSNQYGRLRKRPTECQNPILTSIPVFPVPEAPSDRELETADALLLMNQQSALTLPVQEPCVEPAKTVEEVLPSPHPDIPDICFGDAMEHVINSVLYPSPCGKLNGPDTMDSILAEAEYTDAMEHIVGHSLPKSLWGTNDGVKRDAMEVLVETDFTVLVKPSVALSLKECMVKLDKIDNILTYVPKSDYCKALSNNLRPHTRSQCKPKPKPSLRRPRSAQSKETYFESDITSEDEPPNKRQKTIPTSGPSAARIEAQYRQTEQPQQRLPPSRPTSVEASTSTNDSAQADTDSDATVIYEPSEEESPKGRFKITTKTLKKGKKYKCKYCENICDSSRELTEHHRRRHKILYCNVCNKAFNNPTTHARHLRSHTVKGHSCPKCGKQFAYASQLATHQSVHSTDRHKCDFKNCDKSFKNAGDLKRHRNQHTAVKHQCPDCPYSNADLRNFESHRLIHSRITKYICDTCSEEFVYNTQYQRHLKDQKCKIKGEASPEY